MMKRVRISTAVGAFSLHLLASMSFTTDTTQAKKDHERTRVAVQKLQQLVADHEHAIERHETELAQHASEVEAHGRALADTNDDTTMEERHQ